jgi:hypothetical protein
MQPLADGFARNQRHAAERRYLGGVELAPSSL